MKGVVRTRVGYAGGKMSSPTYNRIGDHTETIQIEFDPKVIGYADLLDVFWRTHNPCRKAWSTQYKSAIFVHDKEQEKLAKETAKRIALVRKQEVTTQILPYTGFTLAEDYHQKFQLRRVKAIAKEYTAIYPKLTDFVDSTATTRVNGFLGGHGSVDDLKKALKDLGLSEEAQQVLLKRVKG